MSNKAYTQKMINNTKNNYMRMIIVAMLTFLSSVILARGLGPDLYGTYTYLTWFISILTSIIGLGMPGTITKFLPEHYFTEDNDEAKNIVMYTLQNQIKLSSFISLVMIITIPFWKKYISLDGSTSNILVALAVINIMPSIINALLQNVIQAIQRFDIYAKISIETQIITFLFNSIIALTIKSVELMILIMLISMLYQNIRYFVVIKNSLNINSYKSVRTLRNKKRLSKYAFYMYINILWQQVVWTRSEYFFLGMYCSPKQIALYGLAYSLISFVTMIFSPIMNVVNNYFSELVAKSETELLNNIIFNITKYFSVILVFIYCYSFLYLNDIIQFVYSNKYSEVHKIFLVLLVGVTINQILCVAGSLPFYYEKQKFILYSGIICGFINIIFDIILIPKFGALGAAIANTISQIIFSTGQFIYIILKFKIRFPYKDVIISLICFAITFVILLQIKMIIPKILLGIAFFIINILILNKLKIFEVKVIKSIIVKNVR